MVQTVQAVTADALACFQSRPGREAAAVINLPQIRVDGIVNPVRPVNGRFAFRVRPGGSCVAHAFDTTYTIKHMPDEDLEPAPAQGFQIAAWTELGDLEDADRATRLAAVQRHLQILGYYTGHVDGIMGPLTERAILGFQADNNLRTDGVFEGLAAVNTRNAITREVNHCRTGNAYIVHRQLIRFTRAPSDQNATATSGRPFKEAPEVDDRGWIQTTSAGIDNLRGPVVSMARQTTFRVKVVREFISNRAVLTVASADTSLVEVVDTVLPAQREMVLHLKAKSPGRAPRSTTVEVRCKAGAREVVLATLNVVVLPLLMPFVRLFWVSIADAAGNNPTPPAGALADYQAILDIANQILWPCGISFRQLQSRTKRIRLGTAGRVSADVNDSNYPEFTTMANAVDTANRADTTDCLNIYLVRNIEGANGETFMPLIHGGPFGIMLKMGAGGRVGAGIDLAHEMGHFMGLSVLTGAVKPHVEDDPDANHKKKDIWSIRRLMFGNWPADPDVRAGDAWAQDVGYGNNQYGAQLSVRHLPQDATDDECLRIRNRIGNNHFYG